MIGGTTAHFAGAFFIAKWSDLARWDIKSARAASFRAAYPHFLPLGDFIEEATEIVRPSEKPDHEWPVDGVSNRSGVEFSHHQPGREFNAPYKRIKKDWFFHNPTRANVGSLGRVGAVPEDAITSPEYQVWRIKGGLLPDFVELLIGLPLFLNLVQCHRVGAVKERLFVQNLMEIPVPAFQLDQQQAIVDYSQKAVNVTKAIKEHQARLSNELNEWLFGQTDQRAFKASSVVVGWSELGTWNVQNARAAIFKQTNPAFVPFAAFAEEASVNVRPADDPDHEWPVYGVNNQHGVFFSHLQKGSEFNSPYKRIQADWFFHNPTRSAVGSLGHVPSVPEDAITSPEYQVWKLRDLGKESLQPDFVATLIQTPWFVKVIQFHRVGAVKQRLYVENLLAIPVPKFPKQLQDRVAKERAKIAAERTAAATLAADTTREVEEMILGLRPVPITK